LIGSSSGSLIYSITGTAWMLTGFGGPGVTHYVGLLSDAPLLWRASLSPPPRYAARPVVRCETGWICLAVALALYFLGVAIGTVSWLRGQDPFPGPADIMFCLFYPMLAAAVLFLIRAAAVRVP